jgi:hypothetical protein
MQVRRASSPPPAFLCVEPWSDSSANKPIASPLAARTACYQAAPSNGNFSLHTKLCINEMGWHLPCVNKTRISCLSAAKNQKRTSAWACHEPCRTPPGATGQWLESRSVKPSSLLHAANAEVTTCNTTSGLCWISLVTARL